VIAGWYNEDIKMKRYFYIFTLFAILVIAIAFSSLGCGGGSGEATTTSTTTSTTTTQTIDTTTTTTSSSTTTSTLPSYLAAYFNPQTYAPTCLAMFYRNPPVLVDGHIYIGTSRPESRYSEREDWNDNYFFKLDQNLNLVWAYFLGDDEVKGGAAPDSANNIYFIAARHTSNPYPKILYKISSTGSKEWEVNLGTGGSNFGTETPAISSDDKIFASGQVLKAYDTNGSYIWGPDLPANAPVIFDSNGNLYFTYVGRLYSYTSGGTERWATPLDPNGESVSGAALSSDESRVYVAVHHYIGCFNASNGSLIWVFTAEAGSSPVFRSCPAVDENNVLYQGTKDGEASIFYALNPDGTVKWQKATGADLYSTPALANNGYIYVGSEGTRLQSFNKESGENNADYPLGLPYGADITYSSPLINSDGTLFIGTMARDTTEAGVVLAIRTTSTGLSTIAAWPRFQGSNRGTGNKGS